VPVLDIGVTTRDPVREFATGATVLDPITGVAPGTALAGGTADVTGVDGFVAEAGDGDVVDEPEIWRLQARGLANGSNPSL
jgi:hypothetical protein